MASLIACDGQLSTTPDGYVICTGTLQTVPTGLSNEDRQQLTDAAIGLFAVVFAVLALIKAVKS